MLERLSLVLFGLLLSFLMLEIGLRVFSVLERTTVVSFDEQLKLSEQATPVENVDNTSVAGLIRRSPFPDIVYELKPNLRGNFQGQPLETNSFGMRDREYLPDKPERTYRIVGLGDSVMFGWGVRAEDSFLSLLEEKLNASASESRSYEVLNFGVPGYNTAMEVALFEHRAVHFDPDLVVIHFVRNDIEVPLFMNQPVNPLDTTSLKSVDFIEEHVQALFGQQKLGLLGVKMTGLERQERSRVLSQYRYMLGQEGYRRAMAKLAEIASERQIPILVAVSSASERMKRVIRHKVVERWGFELLEFKPFVDRYALAHFSDQSKEARSRKLHLSKHDHHPNALGHQIYADALYEAVKRIER